ncbi:MAG: GNAT family N-acetyltransferase [Mycobacteriales bacterium]
MTWQFTDQVETYARWTWPLLAADPARNTIALTVIENVRAGRRWSPKPMTFGWFASGKLAVGAVSMTPPYELLLAEVPTSTIAPLADALAARGVVVTGVNAETAVAGAFASAWTSRRPARAVPRRKQRLYQLDVLLPARPAGGRARPAVPGDSHMAMDWFTRFQVEAGSHVVDVEPVVRQRIDDQLLWLWENDDGHPVSMAGRNKAAAGVARIGPVYTPPEHRRRGYGAAITGACTSDALSRGAHDVVLFTDLANPTSNAIYQQIGYRPLCDHLVIEFEEH